MKSLYKVIKSTRVDLQEEVNISGDSLEIIDEYNIDSNSIDNIRENTLENTIKYKLKLEKQAKQTLNEANISAQVIVEEAKEMANNIVLNAKSEAELLLKTESEKGYEVGFEQAYNESLNKYNSLIDIANQIINDANKYKQKTLDYLEPEIIDLVINCVQKIIHKTVDENDDIVIGIIKNAIDAMTYRDYLIITVSKEEYEIVEQSKNKILATFPGINTIEIKISDNFDKGDIEIESESGSINPSINYQIKKMIEDFNKLIKSSDKI